MFHFHTSPMLHGVLGGYASSLCNATWKGQDNICKNSQILPFQQHQNDKINKKTKDMETNPIELNPKP
jgi:hypothetical protein